MIQLFSAVISVAAFFIYLFGLSSEAKHKVDRQIVTTFGRNKFSETLKSACSYLLSWFTDIADYRSEQVWRLPDKKKEPVKQLKHDIKKVAGKVKNTPVGKTTGETWHFLISLVRIY